MNDEENKIIEKIEKLIALSGSDNENEAKAAMLKAQELMAKYEIEQDRIDPERKKERPVVCFTSPMFRDDWCVDVGSLIANNFRCRAIISQRRNSGGAYRLEFFGFEEDAEISINVFNYAVKVIRKRMATLRAIYRDAEREFGRNEKMAYVDGFCSGPSSGVFAVFSTLSMIEGIPMSSYFKTIDSFVLLIRLFPLFLCQTIPSSRPDLRNQK